MIRLFHERTIFILCFFYFYTTTANGQNGNIEMRSAKPRDEVIITINKNEKPSVSRLIIILLICRLYNNYSVVVRTIEIENPRRYKIIGNKLFELNFKTLYPLALL